MTIAGLSWIFVRFGVSASKYGDSCIPWTLFSFSCDAYAFCVGAWNVDYFLLHDSRRLEQERQFSIVGSI
jgi:hypothetical protein